jgi:ubiquinone/menaquinone biosynthesis C-methylase UbiE
VPDKEKAFSEIFRVLKPGGHLSVSDVVLRGELPAQIQQAAEMYAGCVSGAINMEDYIGIMNKQGFKNIIIHKEKEISLPADLLSKYLDKNKMNDFKDKKSGIFSITVSAVKS